MKKIIFAYSFLCLSTVQFSLYASGTKNISGWQAGFSRIIITPSRPMWMAGYVNRDHAADGKLQELWAKALALEDENGKRCVLITADIGIISKEMSDRIRDQLKARNGLTREQIIINCSGTHSGPLLQNPPSGIYPLDAGEQEKIKNYSALLESQLLLLVTNAFKDLKPVDMFSGNGFARFQINRRNNNEASLLLQTELKGPNDYAVPVIKITDRSNTIIAIVFGYACQNSVLNGYQWSGDYAGFAQLELEKLYPGTVALFFQGAGADQNPLPRRTVSLARQYGKELAYAVDKVLNENMQTLSPQLTTAYSEIELRLNAIPSREQLVKMSEDPAAYKKRSVSYLIQQMDAGKKMLKSYSYPIQVWKLGSQAIFALGGELTVHYAIELKKMFGRNIFVMGYSNDVMAYIPSVEILRESNDQAHGYAFYDPTNHESVAYEGGLFTQIAFGLPATWSSDIETLIFSAAQRLAVRAGVALIEYK